MVIQLVFPLTFLSHPAANFSAYRYLAQLETLFSFSCSPKLIPLSRETGVEVTLLSQGLPAALLPPQCVDTHPCTDTCTPGHNLLVFSLALL